MRKKSVLFRILLLAVLLLGAGLLFVSRVSWGFAREVSPEERALRLQLVEAAQGWLGRSEEDFTMASGVCSVLTIPALLVFCIMAALVS